MSKRAFAHRLMRAAIVVGALIVASILPLNASAQVATPTFAVGSRFILSFGGTQVTFQELKSITTGGQATPNETTSGVTHTQQFGTPTVQPQVVLQNGVDAGTAIWDWHQAVMSGDPSARKDADLFVASDTCSAGSSSCASEDYHLTNAWPSEIVISGTKAGGTEEAITNVTITADQIALVPVAPAPTATPPPDPLRAM